MLKALVAMENMAHTLAGLLIAEAAVVVRERRGGASLGFPRLAVITSVPSKRKKQPIANARQGSTHPHS